MEPQLAARIRKLPEQPGIYIFLDRSNRPLYVGKANSLRKRVTAYLKRPMDARLAAMVAEAAALDFVVTDSEAEALLLENNWIKQRQPRYNIRLRDDKTYPYLKLTLADEYPRLAFTRRIVDDGAEYYGPYLPAGKARRAIKLVQKLFQIRVCNIEIDGSLPRPCLYHDMERCLGPCVQGLVTKEEYESATAAARLFLQGKTEALSQDLKREMRSAAEKLDFERAAQLRDVVYEIEELTERRKLSSARGEDVDIYGVYTEGGSAAVTVLIMRAGQVLDRRELFWEGVGEVEPARLLSEVVPQIYDRTTFVPKEIHLPHLIEGDDVIAEWLSERKQERVYFRYPARGGKADRVELAMRNAKLAYRRRFRGAQARPAGAQALQRHLDLADPPRRIEAFDISNFQGSETVASLVVWQDDRMRKSDYRSFNIRGLDRPDDFASMRQAVERRYRRHLDELGEMPDLVLIDGGRGQLNAALEALSRLGVEETQVVALAKEDEEVYVPGLPQPLRLPRTDPALQLLQRVRDEAHRFAVDRHRRRRKARTLRSGLDDLRGVGPKRRKALIRRFGSLAGVRQASVAELQEALGPRLGRTVYEQLRAESESSGAGKLLDG